MSKRKHTECPVCYDDDHLYSTNWHCCFQGHSWCEPCSLALHKAECPVCKEGIDVNPSKRVKNLLMKQLIGQEMTVCEHCNQTMTKEAYADHDVVACEKKAEDERMVSKTLGNGEIHYYEGNRGKEKLVRMEFASEEEIHFYDGMANLLRMEFKCKNSCICYYNGDFDKLYRMEFASGHFSYGTILHYEKKMQVRATYAKGHKFHGMVKHYDEHESLYKIDFEEGHPLCRVNLSCYHTSARQLCFDMYRDRALTSLKALRDGVPTLLALTVIEASRLKFVYRMYRSHWVKESIPRGLLQYIDRLESFFEGRLRYVCALLDYDTEAKKSGKPPEIIVER
jgi:hypothetical protein